MTGTPKVHSRANAPRLPPFLKALCSILADEGNKKTVSWTAGGKSFIILDEAAFCRDVLPNYFKHNKLASFVRQANMYYFRKVAVGDTKWLEFAHEENLFDRARPDLVWSIQRRPRDGSAQRQLVASDNGSSANALNSAILQELVDIVGTIARTMPKSQTATAVNHRVNVLAKTLAHQAETSGRGEKRAYLTSASSPASPVDSDTAAASPARAKRCRETVTATDDDGLSRSLSITNYSVVEEMAEPVVSTMYAQSHMTDSMFFVDEKSSEGNMSWQDLEGDFARGKPFPAAAAPPAAAQANDNDECAAPVPLSPTSDAAVAASSLSGFAYDNPDGELFYGKAVRSKLNANAMPPSTGADVVAQSGSDGQITLRTSSMS